MTRSQINSLGKNGENKKRSNQMPIKIEKSNIRKSLKFVALLGAMLLFVSALTSESLAQRQTPIGELNGKPLYTDDFINQINNDSPFMPALEDDKITQDPTGTPAPNATPVPTPLPRPAAPSFDKQIDNMMKTAKDWLFVSILNTVVRPMLPYLTFFA